jgi:hypothetical protein
MKKDIPQHKVEDMAIAIVPREKNGVVDFELWDSYIINFKEGQIKNVLINSHGYGEVDGKQMKTTTLRHFFEEIGPLQIHKIEPIQTKLFGLTNEYWVSFQFDNYMYDKRYVFVKGSIDIENFTTIPFLDKKGVMIR